MGHLMLTRFLSARRERRRRLSHRQIQRDLDKQKALKRQHGDNTQGCKGIGSDPYLPEDIMRHIHGLMPLQDAARAACISHTFLRSWRCYPNLTFTLKTLGLDKSTATEDDISRYFINKVEHILQNHAGIGVKALKLELCHCSNADLCYLDSWLQIAVTPGIEELTLMLPYVNKAGYTFPHSLLFDRGGNSVQYLYLTRCTFRPTVGLGCLRRLRQLQLYFVRITGDELQLLLSKSFALECLTIAYCDEIIRVNIPCLLQQLNRLQANIVSYLRTKLLSMVPNVEALTIHSPSEIDNTPMVPGKFLHLKYLHVCFAGLTFSPAYDYLSLVSFFDASPSLETFKLSVSQHRVEHEQFLKNSFIRDRCQNTVTRNSRP